MSTKAEFLKKLEAFELRERDFQELVDAGDGWRACDSSMREREL